MNTVGNRNQRKHTFKWIKSILHDDYLLVTQQPWLVFDAIDFLNSLDLSGKHIFEYGSGYSTLYWLKRGAHVISIEHDLTWYNNISSVLGNNKRLDYRLVCPDNESNTIDLEIDPSDPDEYVSFDSKNRNYKKYVCQIDDFQDGFFDLINIDGRARPSCIKHAVKKVKIKGLIIVDNADRDYYFMGTRSYFTSFERMIFEGVGPYNSKWWRTDIFCRVK